MNKAIDEAIAMTNVVLTALLTTVQVPQTGDVSQLNYLVGKLQADAPSLLDIPAEEIADLSDYFDALADCFDQATTAGATFETMQSIVNLSFSPAFNLGAAILNFVARLALAAQVKALALVPFTSRTQIDNYLTEITNNFATAISVAANNMDQAVYTALIKMQSACVSDLSTRALPLPEIIEITFNRSLPVLALAQRLYQDPSQTEAIVAMNGIRAPLFAPRTLKVLSSGDTPR